MHTRIICVDTEPARVEKTVEGLRAAGYEVMVAFSPEVGLALVRLFRPDLVLLHADLARTIMGRLRQASSSLPIYVTGDAPVSPDELQFRAGDYAVRVEHKPAC